MKFRNYVFTIIAAISIIIPLPATVRSGELERSSPEERAGIVTEWMKTNMGPDAEQLNRLDAVNLAYARKIQAVIDGAGGRIEKLREARRIDAEKDVELAKLLTEKQYRYYLDNREKLRAHVRKRLEEKR